MLIVLGPSDKEISIIKFSSNEADLKQTKQHYSQSNLINKVGGRVLQHTNQVDQLTYYTLINYTPHDNKSYGQMCQTIYECRYTLKCRFATIRQGRRT